MNLYTKENKMYSLNEIKKIHKDTIFTTPEQLGYVKITKYIYPEKTDVQEYVIGSVTITNDEATLVYDVKDMFEDIVKEDGTIITKEQQEEDFLLEVKKQKLQVSRERLESAISKHIQERIDTYNRDQGILLASIDSCAKYALVTDYAHHQFCIDVINWAANVWEYARQVQADVLAGNRTMPTESDLISELPVYNGVV